VPWANGRIGGGRHFRPTVGFSTTADDVLEGIDLAGKTMIVTGGEGGIGLETTRSLAAAGASVTIATRRPREAEQVAHELRKSAANDAIEVRPLDLADLESVQAGSARVVSVSSTGSLFGPIPWDDPHFRFIPYDPSLPTPN
jgi:NADPH:quinone reductase-like Zn-dependent oxidoreductase